MRFMSDFRIFVRSKLWANVPVAILFGTVDYRLNGSGIHRAHCHLDTEPILQCSIAGHEQTESENNYKRVHSRPLLAPIPCSLFHPFLLAYARDLPTKLSWEQEQYIRCKRKPSAKHGVGTYN